MDDDPLKSSTGDAHVDELDASLAALSAIKSRKNCYGELRNGVCEVKHRSVFAAEKTTAAAVQQTRAASAPSV
jgi:hypothetical protein